MNVRIKTIISVCLIISVSSILFPQDDLPEINVTKLTNNIYKFYVNNYVGFVAMMTPEDIHWFDSRIMDT